MLYVVRVAPSAGREILRLPRRYADAVLMFLDGPLRENPRRVGGALAAPWAGHRAARVGPYRIVYRITDDEGDAPAEVLVVRIRHRADVYGR